METGRNLHLESLQDRETYDSRNTGGGFSVSVGGGHVSGSGSAQKQTLRSDYESVREQAGVYAGDQGFQIQAGGNTHLKGAVIHSDAPAEKNRLETGTLSWEDVENRASYKADGQGVAFSATTRTGQEDRRKLNERGLYPEVVSTCQRTGRKHHKSRYLCRKHYHPGGRKTGPAGKTSEPGHEKQPPETGDHL
ncbi:MAG: hemagglutinin repeat-containing protein [Acidaminococcus sp.]|uniref:hemagglutinin repeat-containing protein n=1 Tax=Acidaminococcus sp. TaxID=1872103 RepID=UPI0026DEA767|nr:hemagglutinin repeat-containing protein [Acidaminococcus sp.]MDO5597494.1 hemagglutinin repeat-containing protein [Acidaminococcus sp.]